MNAQIKDGFLQVPRFKMIDHKEYFLEQTLTHTKTGNEYLIKEIQQSGLICILTKTLGADTKKDMKTYISNMDLHEYR